MIRSRVYSIINIAGLTLGLTCVLLIVLYVKDEVSFDRFHQNAGRLYRVIIGADDPRAAGMPKWGITGLMQGPSFASRVPGIEAFVRVGSGSADIRTADGVVTQSYLYADPDFFSVFSFPFKSGNAATALSGPNLAVISEDLAKRQFGTLDAVGKLLYMKTGDKFEPYQVTGVAKRCPQNSSIQFDMVLRLNEPADMKKQPYVWQSFFLTTYVLLAPHADKRTVEKGMTAAYHIDAADVIQQMEKQFKMKDPTFYALQPFMAMHLATDVRQEDTSNVSKPLYAYILSGIAFFILLIACINFVNLSVARSLKRAREIGVRKVLGGERRQLMLQFMGEAMLLCLAAFGAALLLVPVVLPLFNELANKALAFSYLLDAQVIATYVGLFVITGLLAGFYPALVLSRFHPARVLYGRVSFSGKNYLQKGLVVLQFGLASFLIIGTVIIFLQFHHLTAAKLGYDESGLVLVNKDGLTRKEVLLLRSELLKNSSIISVAPKDGGFAFNPVKINNDSSVTCVNVTVDDAFLPMLKIPVIEGRNFSAQYPMDSSTSVIVNESFVKKAGWKEAIGQQVDLGDRAKYTVVGVVKDYHVESLAKAIEPELLSMRPANDYGMVYIKIQPGPSATALRHIEKTFRTLFPSSPYSYIFKDEENRRQYAIEAKWKQIILFGAVLTIFISCIGLFGLSVLATERRTKEIGIRKVLGASVMSVTRILAGDFVALVGISLLLAVPLAWWVASKWLENYPYRIGLNAWIFGGAGLLVVVIAVVTVSFQAVRAGRANPVKSLHFE